jgi:hypothetical protein
VAKMEHSCSAEPTSAKRGPTELDFPKNSAVLSMVRLLPSRACAERNARENLD